MRTISTVSSLFALLICGCSNQTQVSQVAADYLGAGPVHVLSSPTKIEGWNFQRPDGTIASEVPLRPLDLSIGNELGRILLDRATYRTPAGTSGFRHTVGFRVWRNAESVDVLLSFGNDQMELRYRGDNSQTTSTSSTVAGARSQLLDLAKRAFPDFRPPGK